MPGGGYRVARRRWRVAICAVLFLVRNPLCVLHAYRHQQKSWRLAQQIHQAAHTLATEIAALQATYETLYDELDQAALVVLSKNDLAVVTTDLVTHQGVASFIADDKRQHLQQVDLYIPQTLFRAELSHYCNKKELHKLREYLRRLQKRQEHNNKRQMQVQRRFDALASYCSSSNASPLPSPSGHSSSSTPSILSSSMLKQVRQLVSSKPKKHKKKKKKKKTKVNKLTTQQQHQLQQHQQQSKIPPVTSVMQTRLQTQGASKLNALRLSVDALEQMIRKQAEEKGDPVLTFLLAQQQQIDTEVVQATREQLVEKEQEVQALEEQVEELYLLISAQRAQVSSADQQQDQTRQQLRLCSRDYSTGQQTRLQTLQQTEVLSQQGSEKLKLIRQQASQLLSAKLPQNRTSQAPPHEQVAMVLRLIHDRKAQQQQRLSRRFAFLKNEDELQVQALSSYQELVQVLMHTRGEKEVQEQQFIADTRKQLNALVSRVDRNHHVTQALEQQTMQLLNDGVRYANAAHQEMQRMMGL
jgi:hypothetical protein